MSSAWLIDAVIDIAPTLCPLSTLLQTSCKSLECFLFLVGCVVAVVATTLLDVHKQNIILTIRVIALLLLLLLLLLSLRWLLVAVLVAVPAAVVDTVAVVLAGCGCCT